MATTLEQWWQGWTILAGAAMVFAAGLVSLVYMLGSLLMNEKMKTWAKMELSEVVYSAIIIGVALWGLGMIDGVVQAAIGSDAGAASCDVGGGSTFVWMKTTAGRWECLNLCGEQAAADRNSIYHNVPSCHMRLGIYMLHEIFEETSMVAFDTYVSYIYTAMAADFTINIEFLTEKAGFFTFNPWRGFLTMGNTVKAQVFDYAMKLMMITKFQEVFLYFINIAAFPALFVAGAVLRTFTFSRRLGGLLMAIALVLYFFLPAFYAFGALVMIQIKHDASSFWCSDKDLNPKGCGADGSPDPPIANMMYVKGNIPMPGGQGGGVSTQDMKDELENVKGLTEAEKAEMLRTGEYGGKQYMPEFTLFEDSGKTEQEKQEALKDAGAFVSDYRKDVAGKSLIDTFIVNNAFAPGGPLDVLGRLVFFSAFFSFFGILSCIAAIRSVSITLGGDIEIAGLTRLI